MGFIGGQCCFLLLRYLGEVIDADECAQRMQEKAKMHTGPGCGICGGHNAPDKVGDANAPRALLHFADGILFDIGFTTCVKSFGLV